MSARSTDARGALSLGIALLLSLGTAHRVAAQDGLEKLALDRFQLAGLGVVGGPIAIAQVNPTSIVGLTADYGVVAPGVRAFFSVTFWQSRLTDKVVNAFVDTLRNSLTDSTGDASIKPSHVPIYDLTFSAGARFPIPRNAHTAIRPYLEAGIAAHVINAEGPLINGTFVERSLDAIAAGFFAGGGIELRPFESLGIDAEARGDLLSGFRSGQLRVGAMYYLGPPRRKP